MGKSNPGDRMKTCMFPNFGPRSLSNWKIKNIPLEAKVQGIGELVLDIWGAKGSKMST